LPASVAMLRPDFEPTGELHVNKIRPVDPPNG